MRTKTGFYLHVPFCVRKCNYCDFASFPSCDIDRTRYIKHLTDEILSYRGRGIDIDTVFFGGGTPSLLTGSELSLIMRALRDTFDMNDVKEFTIEVNPATLNEDMLYRFLSCGVTRFSIGLQSIHENELKILGRIHSFGDFMHTYKMLRSNGATNISVDLMHSLPMQTEASLKDTLLRVCELSPEHISAYGLIVEEGTPFYDRRSELTFPDEETEERMYFLTSELLAEAGYSHYEISNFAKPSFECRHNLKYWRCEEYIGVGLAAHSYFNGVRYGNSRCPDEYYSGIGKEITELTPKDKQMEYLMLGLRLSDGISFSELFSRFNIDLRKVKAKEIKMLCDNGYINLTDNGISLTEKGFFVSNSVIAELI